MANDTQTEKLTGTGFKVLLSLACFIIVVAGLRAASELLIPIMLGIFLAVLSMPILKSLTKKRIPRVAALGLTVGFNLLILTLLVFLAMNVIPNFQSKGPKYAELIKTRVETSARSIDLKLAKASGFFETFNFENIIDENGTLLETTSEEKAPEEPPPSQVKVSNTGEGKASITLGLFQKVWDQGLIIDFIGQTELVGRITSLTSKSFFVLIIMIFVLSEAGRFTPKIRQIISKGGPDFRQFQNSASDIQKYLAIKTGVSAVTGILAWLACLAFSVDFPVLWGLIAFLFNYIPAIGSILAAIPAVALALLERGFWIGAAVLLCYLAINIALGNFVEPMLLGDRFGISTTVVILSVLFWGYVWGPVGMFLAVPLTMVIKVSLQTSEDLAWISVLMDNRAVRKKTTSKNGPKGNLPLPTKSSEELV